MNDIYVDQIRLKDNRYGSPTMPDPFERQSTSQGWFGSGHNGNVYRDSHHAGTMGIQANKKYVLQAYPPLKLEAVLQRQERQSVTLLGRQGIVLLVNRNGGRQF
jgi:hypothetical protein